MRRILIVARDASLRAHLAREVKAAGHAVELADGLAHGRRIGFRDVALYVVTPLMAPDRAPGATKIR
jgi:DNA-binding response OmpR family regulator